MSHQPMMPSFSFRQTFKRSSRSFPSSTESVNNAKASNGHSSGLEAPLSLPTRKSSSTLNSMFGGSSSHPGQRTPPSNAESSNSSTVAPVISNTASRPTTGTSPPSTNGAIPPIPSRPQLNTKPTSRYSVAGMSGLGSPSTDGLPTSQYAPVVTSMPSGQTVSLSSEDLYKSATNVSDAGLLQTLTHPGYRRRSQYQAAS